MGDEIAAQASVVCLGLFDGVHIGHRQIVLAGKGEADRLGISLCVHTYDIPPLSLIKQSHQVMELTPFEEKCHLLEKAGADMVAVSRFDEQLMLKGGREFFYDVLLRQLNARHLVAGYDHRFGHKCDTDTDALQALCDEAGIGLTVLSAVTVRDGIPVSSSAIRQAIREGDRVLAEEMLGRSLSERLLGLLGKSP